MRPLPGEEARDTRYEQRDTCYRGERVRDTRYEQQDTRYAKRSEAYLVRALLITIITALLFSLPSLAFEPKSPQIPRHKNPDEITEEKIAPLEFFALYGTFMDLMTRQNWDLASSLLQEASSIYIPENLADIFDRFNESLPEIIQELRNTKNHLDIATILMAQARIDETDEEVKKALASLAKTGKDLKELDTLTKELAGAIGLSPELIMKEGEKLKELVKNFYLTTLQLNEDIEEKNKLPSTFLEISAEEEELIVGSPLKIYGKLTEANTALSGKDITLFLEEERASITSTEEDGSFTFIIDTPLLYKPTIKAYTAYLPQGEDAAKYAPSFSNALSLKLVYYLPLIEASYEEPAYPGLPFEIKGHLSLAYAPLKEYPLEVIGFNQRLELSTDEKGEFVTQLAPPPKTTLKKSIVKISTPPRGIIAPSSLTLAIPLTYKIPSVALDTPSIVFSAFSFSLQGKLTLDGQILKEPTIKVITGENEYSISSLEGENFAAEATFPLSATTGWQNIIVSVTPWESWIASVTQENRVLVINPIMLIPFAAILTLLVGVSRKKKKKIRKAEEEPQGVLTPQTTKKPETKKEKLLPDILRAYEEAVERVSKITDKMITPSQTTREYSEEVKKPLKEAYPSFKALSLMVEKFLYARGLEKDEENKFLQYYEEFTRILQRFDSSNNVKQGRSLRGTK